MTEIQTPDGTVPTPPETPAPPPPPPVPPRPPVDPVKRSHTWGMLCHLSALCILLGVPFGQILGPLVVWLIKKDEHPFVDDQGRESLNFQLSMLIYTVGSAFLICLCVGIALIVMLALLNFIFVIVASIRAANGEAYRYPMTIRFLK